LEEEVKAIAEAHHRDGQDLEKKEGGREGGTEGM